MNKEQYLNEHIYYSDCDDCGKEKEKLYFCSGDCGYPICEDCLVGVKAECIYQKCLLTYMQHGIILTEEEEIACENREHPVMNYRCQHCIY